jgi:hypothetical protein
VIAVADASHPNLNGVVVDELQDIPKNGNVYNHDHDNRLQ